MEIINNITEFGDYLMRIYGYSNVRSGLDDLTQFEKCGINDCLEIGCELYLDGELMDNQEAGLVKFNVARQEMLDMLGEMARQGN